jgi:hypothetical protein
MGSMHERTYGYDALSGVVDLDVAAEAASRRHGFERTAWWFSFVILSLRSVCWFWLQEKLEFMFSVLDARLVSQAYICAWFGFIHMLCFY